MGNLISQWRVKSRLGLHVFFPNSVSQYLTFIYKQKSTFIPKHSPSTGLTVIFHESIPFNSNTDSIVFQPPLIALHLLYSAPGELWNWEYPKPRDFSEAPTITARDSILIPPRPDDVINSEEYTCVISTNDGYPIITHVYGDTIIDCHPIPGHMTTTTLGSSDDNRPVYHGESSSDHLSDEVLKYCYICRKINKQTSDTNMKKNEVLGNKRHTNKK